MSELISSIGDRGHIHVLGDLAAACVDEARREDRQNAAVSRTRSQARRASSGELAEGEVEAVRRLVGCRCCRMV
jgi:hypothetical protein